jgi:hypothetical protein
MFNKLRRLFVYGVLAATASSPVGAIAGWFGASDYGDCIFDRMAGTENDLVARQIAAACLKDFPAGFDGIRKESGHFRRYSSGQECAISKAKRTPSRVAAQLITAVCYRLYEPEPVIDLRDFAPTR